MRTIIGAVVGCVLLTGCTAADWSQTMHYVDMGDDSFTDDMRPTLVSLPASQPPPVSPDLCQSIAHQDAGYGTYDPSTRKSVYTRQLAQCQALTAR